MTGSPRLPFGFANATWRAGDTVVKEFVGRSARQRWADEIAALNDVAHLIPVPRIVEVTEDPPAVSLAYVDAEPASADLTADLATLVAWARSGDVDLTGLEVGSPSLEDAYLTLTGSTS